MATYNAEYLIDSEKEPLRLERQARIYGEEGDRRHLASRPDDKVLDVGCGSGHVSRTISRYLPRGQVTGVDREPRYIDFAVLCVGQNPQLTFSTISNGV